ncbi:MAG: hypothetical protein RMM53_05335, partial [Bacteroidia bacterium]|nr:hypothetical protein [Bacteroidia bacterium]
MRAGMGRQNPDAPHDSHTAESSGKSRRFALKPASAKAMATIKTTLGETIELRDELLAVGAVKDV